MNLLTQQLRPKTLDSFAGQDHLVGDGKPIKTMIEKQIIFSMIFWGPPGTGKTTLARIIATSQQRDFIELSAVSAGKNDVRRIIDQTKDNQKTLMGSYKSPILFLDEIHRFNKAQQDFLLPYVEDGTLILIGATTENPSFEVISPLLSRTRVFIFKKIPPEPTPEI